MFVIEDGIPVPPGYRKKDRQGLADALSEMTVGQSVFVPQTVMNAGSVRTIASRVSKLLGCTFTVRQDDDGVRVWRIA